MMFIDLSILLAAPTNTHSVRATSSTVLYFLLTLVLSEIVLRLDEPASQ